MADSPANNLRDAPLQTGPLLETGGTTGGYITVTVTVSLLLLQMDTRSELTTYRVVVVGVTTGLLQLVQLSEPTGAPPGNTDHIKVFPPDAFSGTELPKQIVVSLNILVTG